jgi:multidrug transporter EmrE-like cation transporter
VWLCAVAGTLLCLPVLAVALVTDPGSLGWTALALMGGSGVLHALYFVLLQRAYGTGDLSVVYPLARGTGPLLSATAAIAFLGERPSLLALAGGALIVAAVFSLAP